MACVTFQEAKAPKKTKQSDGIRRLVSGAYVDFVSRGRCMLRDENPGGCQQGVWLGVGVGILYQIIRYLGSVTVA
jgi:hypothetical protein